jgi:hypothetical protein
MTAGVLTAFTFGVGVSVLLLLPQPNNVLASTPINKNKTNFFILLFLYHVDKSNHPMRRYLLQRNSISMRKVWQGGKWFCCMDTDMRYK